MVIKRQKSKKLRVIDLNDVRDFMRILSKLNFKILRLGTISILLALIEITALLVLASFVNSTVRGPIDAASSAGLISWIKFDSLGFGEQAALCVCIFCIRFVSGLLLQNFILQQTNQLQVSLRSLLFRHALDRRSGGFNSSDKASGAMADVIVRQVTLIGKGIIEPCLRVSGELVVFLGIITIVVIVSPQLLLLMAAVIAPIVLFYILKFKSLSRKFGQRANCALEDVSEMTAVFCAGWRQLSVPHLRDNAISMLEKYSNHFAINDRRANLISAAPRYFLELFLSLFLISAVFWIARSDQMGFEELVFVAGAGLRILPIITSFSNALISFQFNRAVLNNVVAIVAPNIDELLDQSKNGFSAPNVGKIDPTSCFISLQNISFQYTASKPLFEELNEELVAGDFLLITGKSGAGKTTLMDIICGIRSPSKGAVLFNGSRQQENTAPPMNIFYVPQQPLIVPGTILENIVMLEATNISDEQKEVAISALKMVGLWDLIENMPQSINSLVGPDGDKISGGQKQRLVIARALFYGAQVFAFDEVVSGLEVDSKREILGLLKDLAKTSKLIILISHDTVAEEFASKFISL